MQFISSFLELKHYNFNIVSCLFSMASLINFKLQLFRKWPFYYFDSAAPDLVDLIDMEGVTVCRYY